MDGALTDTLMSISLSIDSDPAKRANEPLTFFESLFAVLSGAALGLLGGVLLWSQTSRFKSNGYLLKYSKSWQLYLLGFGSRFAVIILLIIIALSMRH
jgi:hypothetical protein